MPEYTLIALLIATGGVIAWCATLLAFGVPVRRPMSRVQWLRVVEREDVGADLFRIVLARDGWRRRLPAFRPGQYLTVLLPDGATRRCYSLAEWKARPRRYELAIRREAAGVVSQWLHANAQPGCRIAARPPRGAFVMTPAAIRDREVGLVAGGIGITPLRAMVHRLAATPARRPRQLTLFYCVRHEHELMYRAEFERLAVRMSWFRFVPLVSRPTAHWRGRRGRIDARAISAEMIEPRNACFFLCASNQMLERTISELRDIGVADRAIHYERFSADMANSDTRRYHVVVNGVPAPPFQGQASLLRFFEQHGIPIAADCRAGTCGLCRLKLSQGEVAWTVPPECAPGAGQILACCTVPRTDVRLQTLNV